MATRRSRTPWEFQLEQSCRAWRGPVAGFGHCWKATNYRWSTDMMSIAPITEQELHAYLDGELPDARRAAVEAYLREHPEDARRLEAYRADGKAIARIFARAGEHPGNRLAIGAIGFEPPRVLRMLAQVRFDSRAPRVRQLAVEIGVKFLLRDRRDRHHISRPPVIRGLPAMPEAGDGPSPSAT